MLFLFLEMKYIIQSIKIHCDFVKANIYYKLFYFFVFSFIVGWTYNIICCKIKDYWMIGIWKEEIYYSYYKKLYLIIFYIQLLFFFKFYISLSNLFNFIIHLFALISLPLTFDERLLPIQVLAIILVKYKWINWNSILQITYAFETVEKYFIV